MPTITQTVALTIPRGPVTTELTFYQAPEDGSEPYNYVEQPPEGVPARNYRADRHLVTISDLRGHESEFNLDKNAFQVLQGIKSAMKDFDDEEYIKRVYYLEVEKLILDNVSGANRVVIFDHTIRRPGGKRGPVNLVHIDQTTEAAAERVRIHVPDEAEKLLQGRYRIINTWRPINGPVYSNPLSFADGSSVSDDDVIAVKHIYPHRSGQTAGVKYNPNQKWYYLSGITNEERVLLKCSDSDGKVGKWGRAPHSAFTDPRTSPEAPGRESIEVRALVFG